MGLPADNKSDMIRDGKKQKGPVLVADGDNHLRKQLSTILDGMGYDVVVTGNGESALDLFLKRSFDIVFTALKMPGMDGLTLSLHVKASSLNTPVVLILDENIDIAMSRIKAGRFDCVMLKLLGTREIQKAVQFFFRQRRGCRINRILQSDCHEILVGMRN